MQMNLTRPNVWWLPVGGTVTVLGLMLLVISGPGILTIALGLAVLASEFLWARRLLARFEKEDSKISGMLFLAIAEPRAGRSTTELQT